MLEAGEGGIRLCQGSYVVESRVDPQEVSLQLVLLQSETDANRETEEESDKGKETRQESGPGATQNKGKERAKESYELKRKKLPLKGVTKPLGAH